MGNVYLLRHGETALTVQHVFCGALDPPLSELGLASAKKAVKRLEGIDFGRVFVSPLRRCRMTADEFNLEYVVDKALREMDFGSFEGKSYMGAYAENTEDAEEYRRLWPDYTFPGGDNVPAYFKAAGETLAGYLAKYDGNVLLVSHAGFMGAALGAVTHNNPARLFELPIRPCDCFKVYKRQGKVGFEQI